MPGWLKDAVFYEIYPQSFKDSNGDGIGDFAGIVEKLDYIKGLGCNALWINPCYDSPFMDAGYDVRNYKLTAARYGTNDDLVNLFEEAHKRGIHVLLDLVPGHTSDEHEWFIKSGSTNPGEYKNRYVWTNNAFQGIPGRPYIGGMCDRDGCYMLNFFASQPALNYGFAQCTEDWMLPPDHPDCLASAEAMKDVMRFWLDNGCDGFRVDMADSLVKNDDDKKSNTGRIWRGIRQMLDKDYPEAALVSEWGDPRQALEYGFHMDFYLDHHGNGYNLLLREHERHGDGSDKSYFKKDSGGDITEFLKDYMGRYLPTRDKGYISFITCNHDTPRCTRTLSVQELKLAYSFIFTMPGVPFLYYGDEIGMRYLSLPSKEGGYARTGTRTPMQWNSSNATLGFSDGDPAGLYLPVDSDPSAPTVESAEKDPDSLIHTIREIIKLRHEHEDLQADAEFEPLVAQMGDNAPFVYRRGKLILAVNPSGHEVSAVLPDIPTVSGLTCKEIYKKGGSTYDASSRLITLPAQSFVIYA